MSIFNGEASAVQMGLSDMIWGRRTDAMLIEDGGATPFKRHVHPRVEGLQVHARGRGGRQRVLVGVRDARGLTSRACP